jgi:CheY-like chemotaxis protein
MPSLQGIHTIIIDDDETSIEVLRKLLDWLGISSTIISEMENVEQKLRQVPRADIVFIDLEMPIVNGYDVLSFLRSEPQFQDTKFVAYTTHTSHMTSAHQAGFHGFLGKPIDHNMFSKNLERILNGESVWEAF